MEAEKAEPVKTEKPQAEAAKPEEEKQERTAEKTAEKPAAKKKSLKEELEEEYIKSREEE